MAYLQEIKLPEQSQEESLEKKVEILRALAARKPEQGPLSEVEVEQAKMIASELIAEPTSKRQAMNLLVSMLDSNAFEIREIGTEVIAQSRLVQAKDVLAMESVLDGASAEAKTRLAELFATKTWEERPPIVGNHLALRFGKIIQGITHKQIAEEVNKFTKGLKSQLFQAALQKGVQGANAFRDSRIFKLAQFLNTLDGLHSRFLLFGMAPQNDLSPEYPRQREKGEILFKHIHENLVEDYRSGGSGIELKRKTYNASAELFQSLLDNSSDPELESEVKVLKLLQDIDGAVPNDIENLLSDKLSPSGLRTSLLRLSTQEGKPAEQEAESLFKKHKQYHEVKQLLDSFDIKYVDLDFSTGSPVNKLLKEYVGALKLGNSSKIDACKRVFSILHKSALMESYNKTLVEGGVETLRIFKQLSLDELEKADPRSEFAGLLGRSLESISSLEQIELSNLEHKPSMLLKHAVASINEYRQLSMIVTLSDRTLRPELFTAKVDGDRELSDKEKILLEQGVERLQQEMLAIPVGSIPAESLSLDCIYENLAEFGKSFSGNDNSISKDLQALTAVTWLEQRTPKGIIPADLYANFKSIYGLGVETKMPTEAYYAGFSESLSGFRKELEDFLPNERRDPRNPHQMRAPKDLSPDTHVPNYYFSTEQVEGLKSVRDGMKQVVRIDNPGKKDFSDNCGLIVSSKGTVLFRAPVIKYLIESKGKKVELREEIFAQVNEAKILNELEIIVDGKEISLKGAELIHYDVNQAIENFALLRVPGIVESGHKSHAKIAKQKPEVGDNLYGVGFPKLLNHEQVVSTGKVKSISTDGAIFAPIEEQRSGAGSWVLGENGEFFGITYPIIFSGFTDQAGILPNPRIRELSKKASK